MKNASIRCLDEYLLGGFRSLLGDQLDATDDLNDVVLSFPLQVRRIRTFVELGMTVYADLLVAWRLNLVRFGV